MYYRTLGVMDPESVDKMLTLSGEVKYSFSSGSRMRIGRNAPKVLSKYHYAKWFKWKAGQRQRFKDIYPEYLIPMITQAWFLKFDPVEGQLDEMVFAANTKLAGTFVITALKDAQEMLIDGKIVVVNKGETITFNASTLHEVKPSENGQLWLCTMVRKAIEELQDF